MKWKDKILPSYEIRKSAKQKSDFIDMLKENYGEQLHIEESKAFVKSRNIVLGNADKAKVIFTAHYDTCAVLPFPNFITPKNLPVFVLYQLLLTVALLLPAFIAVILVATLISNLNQNEDVGLILSELTMFAVIGFELWWMLAGPENKHTANDNTSGVVAVLTLADRLGFDDYAYILFDNEEKGLLGSASYAKAHPDIRNNTLVVNFDCVSDGDNILMSFSKNAMKTDVYKRVSEKADSVMLQYGKNPVVTTASTTIYPSDQQAFKNSVAVASLNKAKFVGLYMDKIHTSKDIVFMEDNINALTDMFSVAVSENI